MRHWRAADRPSSLQLRASLRSRGITSVMMGMGGLYLLSRLAVVPVHTHTHTTLTSFYFAGFLAALPNTTHTHMHTPYIRIGPEV